MKRRTVVLGVAALVMGFSAATQAFADTVVYSQPVVLDTGFYSYPNDFTAYDDFTLASGAIITSVDWAGNTSFGGTPASFTLSFYSDNDGAPGTLLSSTTTGDGDPVGIGTDNNGLEVYSYSAAVNPFTATAGTQYWLSVFDNNTDNAWAWETGTGGNGQEVSINSLVTLRMRVIWPSP